MPWSDNLVPIVVAVAVLSLVAGPLVRRLTAGRRAADEERLRDEAAMRGLRVDAAGPEAPSGSQVFSGTSEGLAWSAQVEVRGGARSRRPVSQRTLLTFGAVTAAPGKFVLAMALPPGVKVPPAPAASGGGLLATLAAKAAEGVLDLYVGGYFGAEHRALVNVEGAARPEGPAGFFLLATDEALAARVLDAEGQALLVGLHQPGAGPALDKALQAFGLLITPAGLHYAVQAALRDPAELEAVAERVARLAARAARR